MDRDENSSSLFHSIHLHSFLFFEWWCDARGDYVSAHDACLNTLTDEISQVTTRVGRIARHQAHLGGFVASPSPSPQASEDEDYDDGSVDDNDDEDKDASYSSDEEMTASQ